MRKLYRRILVCAGFCLIANARHLYAYTVITLSGNVPEAVETQLIASTTNQFQSTLFVNPLASNTYQIKLLGVNPNYNPPPTNKDLLNVITTISTQTYVYGFVDGMTYQQGIAEGAAGRLENLCNSATNYALQATTPQTFDSKTCFDVLSTFLTTLFQMSLSTPTVIPPPQ